MRLAKALFADVFSQIRFDIRGYIQAAVCQIRRKSDLLLPKSSLRNVYMIGF